VEAYRAVIDKRLIDIGEVVSLKCRPSSTPTKISDTLFCYRLSNSRNILRMEGLGKLKKSSNLIWIRARDLPVGSIVP
jgi:hypothetical protein